VWQRPNGQFVLLILGVGCASMLGWLGHRVQPPLPILNIAGGGLPHVSGELLRLIAGAAISWSAYRYGEWQTSSGRFWRGMACTAGIGALCWFGLTVSDDMGPILIMSLALLLFLAAPAVRQIAHTRSERPARRRGALALAVLCTAVFVSGGIALWQISLTDWAPQFSRTAAVREAARLAPFSAVSPNLAQVHWLMDAARNVGGFGLGRVPYCGARAQVEPTACTLSSGAPIQLPLDFAFSGLAATWNLGGAAACIGLLFIWLRALVLSATPSGLRGASEATDLEQCDDPLAWLRAWIVAVPCLMAQAQTLVSVGGTLTWTPLSGVTLPLLGYGTTALCICAFWVGLSVRTLSHGTAVRPQHNASI